MKYGLGWIGFRVVFSFRFYFLMEKMRSDDDDKDDRGDDEDEI